MIKTIIIAAMAGLPIVAYYGNPKSVTGQPENAYENLYTQNMKGMAKPDIVSLVDSEPGTVSAQPVLLASTSSKTCSQRCSTTCSSSCTTTRGCSSSCKKQTDGCGGGGGNESTAPLTIKPPAAIPRSPARTPLVTGVSTNSPVAAETGYWITGTGKRHNKSCRYYKTTSGRFCTSTEGIACKICGG